MDTLSKFRSTPLVLVVDDDSDHTAVTSLHLRYSGYQVEEATSGDAALTKAFVTLPDLVLLDLVMPGIKGIDIISLLKSDRRTRHIRSIVLTGWTDESVLEEAKAAGCDSFLVKPCPPDTLLDEIRRVLGSTCDPTVEPS